ncbi:MAG: carbohydrate kinase family protein [Spirochaetales bacterium]|nr:carbohydrate kinase family protein [Spirochaetales bacterium]
MIHGMGKLCLDNLMRVDHYPEKNSLVHITGTEYALGGMAANALKAADHFGSPTMLYAHIGRDETGQILLDELAKTGINRERINYRDKSDYSNIILYQDIRSIMSCRQIKNKSAGDFSFSFSEGDILLIDCTVMEGTSGLLKEAKERGVITVMDVSPSHLAVELENFFPHIDYLIPSYGWAAAFAGEEDVNKLGAFFLKRGVENFIMTNGSEKLHYFSKYIYRTYLPEPVRVVNSNGAGDTFHGAFCHGLEQSWEWEKVLLFAMAAATDRCTRFSLDDLSCQARVEQRISLIKTL